MHTILSISGISKRFGHVRAVNSLSLTVEKGQVFGLLGPNGSGKTTTLGIILGAIPPDAGSYEWFGKPADADSRKRVGAILEQPNFYPWLSGRRNLNIVAAIREVSTDAVEHSLRQTGLWDRRNESFGAYSFGMKQRLGLSAALLGDPDVLVLDEPTNGVDAQGIAEIRDIIMAAAGRGKTIILASHILDEVEKVCTHVAILKDGAILDTGSIDEVIKPGGGVEVACDDMESLSGALEKFSEIKNIKRDIRWFCVTLNPGVSAGELNRFLINQGIAVSHLVSRRNTLESHFLELLEEKNEASA